MSTGKKASGSRAKLIKTVISAVLVVAMIAMIAAANYFIPSNSSTVESVLGIASKGIDNSNAKTEGLDLDYTKPSYATQEDLAAYQKELDRQIAGEGVVLLKNEGLMPFDSSTTFSFFGHSSVSNIGSGNLKGSFEAEGFGVNEGLWNFYESGKGSEGYGLGVGSVMWGDDEDFSINEVPLSVVLGESGMEDSFRNTVPVFVLSRVAGEGRDMPRSMYNHAKNPEDQAKTYLEPDSTELEILGYLNEHFDNVVLLVSSAAALDLDWTVDYEHITAIVSAPHISAEGMYSVAGIFSGRLNPSGRTVDTFEKDAMSSPAAQNFGDFQYINEDGSYTKYNYVEYLEGIYVGYRYYETRYEDVVLGQGNAGDFKYNDAVMYPFGYGLSYTTFEWSNFNLSWNGDTATVTVSVKNTGNAAGKDVVQVYAQSPYTDYDKQNHVEKSAVELVGYAKTSELAPGASETVTVTFDKEQFKAYDYTNAKTYILDAGTYYITAAADAHKAVNNVLAAKGKTMADGMTEDGNADFVADYVVSQADMTSYAADAVTGVAITNQLDDANGGFTYLTRNDWTGTFPKTDGEVGTQVSTWGNQINGADGISYTFTKTINAETLAKLDSFDSLNPDISGDYGEEIVYGEKNDVTLIQLRGLDYNDPLWDKLLDELTQEDYQLLITQSGYGSYALASIDKPAAVDRDAATGIMDFAVDETGFHMFGYAFSSPIVIAQTWNQELARAFGEQVGEQAQFTNVNGWYAPAMNIHRTPFSGRNSEYYSEDGFLSGTMAREETIGAAQGGLYIFVKHFAVNDQKNHRGDRDGQFSLATFLNEQAAREIYLEPFEICMKSGTVEENYVKTNADGSYEMAVAQVPACNAIMTSFNRLGYTWAGGHYGLMTGILRNEWGFKGFAVTDNANTGVFMDAGQMIQAGGDGKLTNLPSGARYTFDVKDPTDYHYGRIAAHHILYSIVNSNAMDGGMPGSRYVPVVAPYQMLIYGIDAVCGVIALALVVLTVLRYRKKEPIKN